jgi:F-type H+-transporting ATPase subunit alpha
MIEILKQGQYSPMDVVDEVLIIFAGTRGFLDKVPRNQVSAWEKGFLTFVRDQKSEIRNKILETRDLDDATMKLLTDAIGEYQKQFAAGETRKV